MSVSLVKGKSIVLYRVLRKQRLQVDDKLVTFEPGDVVKPEWFPGSTLLRLINLEWIQQEIHFVTEKEADE